MERNSEIDPISCFNELFSDYLGGKKITDKVDTSPGEVEIIKTILDLLNEMLRGGNGRRRIGYYLGLVIDFCLLVEKCLGHIGDTEEDLSRDERAFFDTFPLIQKRGETQANTLTVQLGTGGGTCGIRKIEEMVISYFEAIERVGYPSAYVYNTGQWHKYQDTLGGITRLSSKGRRLLLYRVINRSLSEYEVDPTSIAVDPIRFSRFSEIIKEYPRSNPQWENGGLAFQSMCYAYLAELYRDYSVVASSVRTGSSRQKRIGDIDIYDGHALIASCEVKDFHISNNNFDDEFLGWRQKAYRLRAKRIVACSSVDQNIIDKHQDIEWLTIEEMASHAQRQSAESRERMTSRFLHYLIIIERNPKSLKRALEFIASRQRVADLAE